MEVEDNNNYFINDILTHNCQNVTYDNSRTLMTRIGSNSKFIILGDINQIDLRNKKDSSLETMLKMFIGVDNIGTIEMSEEDTNVRNPLITKIEEKYREFSRDSLNKSYKQLLVESIK
jgi:phosphate starvation-inducible protein PhoH and related proteins